MYRMPSPSRQRPARSPVKTRGVTNRKAPIYTRASNGYDGPLERAPIRKSLPTVPEHGNGATPAPSPEILFVWGLTIALVIYWSWQATDPNFKLISSSPNPTPPMSFPLPCTIGGFLRKAFSLPPYD